VVDRGNISSSLPTKWNLQNAFVHEGVHLTQPLDVYDYKAYAPYFELDAYEAQMQHSSWNNATSEFQNYMLGNTEGYLNQLKESNNSATQKRYQDYVKFFNSKK
jgi:hypothetical protein